MSVLLAKREREHCEQPIRFILIYQETRKTSLRTSFFKSNFCYLSDVVVVVNHACSTGSRSVARGVISLLANKAEKK